MHVFWAKENRQKGGCHAKRKREHAVHAMPEFNLLIILTRPSRAIHFCPQPGFVALIDDYTEFGRFCQAEIRAFFRARAAVRRRSSAPCTSAAMPTTTAMRFIQQSHQFSLYQRPMK